MTDLLFLFFHLLPTSCSSPSLFLFVVAALWLVGYSCCARATAGSNGFSLGQNRNLAALAGEKKAKIRLVHLSLHLFDFPSVQQEFSCQYPSTLSAPGQDTACKTTVYVHMCSI